jgi:hypothetical protein
VSLVLLAILVVIWASILVPLLRGDRGTWPGGRRPLAPSGNAAAARGGRAVWRPAPQTLEEAEVTVPELTVAAPAGGAWRTRHPWAGDLGAPDVPAGPSEVAAGTGWAAAGRGGPAAGRRALFRRRRVLAVLLLLAVATAVPALLLGGGWLALELAPGLLLAGYLLALVLLARRRHGASRPAPARPPVRPLAAVPAAPE